MAFDVTTPETPGWWLVRLINRLQAERPEIDHLERMFRGEHDLPVSSEDQAEAFRNFQKMCRSNYIALVVEAALERMKVTGFRAGPDDKAGDKDSWRIWQQARLDADQVLVHRTMLSARRAYVIVGPHPRKRGEVLITPEHPAEVITESYPDDRREVRAALKMFTDEVTGYVEAYLYLPHRMYRFRSKDTLPTGALGGGISGTTASQTFYMARNIAEWTVVADNPNPTAPVVPVVEFANRPSLRGRAVAEFEDVIDIQNRINQTLMHRLVAEKFGVMRQTAVMNLAFEEDEDGNYITPDLPNDPGVAWLLQGENLSMWQSQQTSTDGIMAGVEADIRDLAAITRTPPHYLLNSIVNASGDALKSAETGLVAKVREHLSQAGEAWEQVIALAHLVLGNDRTVADLETVWADPESRSLAEISDAVQKQSAVGVPWNMCMEMLGYTPTQIQRMASDRAADAMLAAIAAPDPVAAPQQPAQAAPGATQEQPPPVGNQEPSS